MTQVVFKSFETMSAKEQEQFVKRSFALEITQESFSLMKGAKTGARVLVYNHTELLQQYGLLPKFKQSERENVLRNSLDEVTNKLRSILESCAPKLGKEFGEQRGVWARVVCGDDGAPIFPAGENVRALLEHVAPAYKSPITDAKGAPIFRVRDIKTRKRVQRSGIRDEKPAGNFSLLGTFVDKDGKPKYVCQWVEEIESTEKVTEQAYYKTLYPAGDIARALWTLIQSAQLDFIREHYKNTCAYSVSK